MSYSLDELRLHSSGKVREIYELDEDLLLVASDRVSIYDVIMPDEIPDKGKVLTGMSVFWFGRTGGIIPNHLISTGVPDEIAGRHWACFSVPAIHNQIRCQQFCRRFRCSYSKLCR